MKILIVEDDVYTRKGLAEVFFAEGYTVISAADGIEGLGLVSSEKPDFICLDIMMPGMNGYDLCREIRKQGCGTPILFISAKSEEIDKVVGLELGADDYIVKPFGVREVLARVKAIYRRYIGSTTGQDSPFMMNGIKIVPPELLAYRGADIIRLTPRDVKILSLFYLKRGMVVTRDELFDSGWGLRYLPNSRTLDQYISQLRKKIEIEPKKPEIIETVHTVGYRYPGAR